MAHLGAVLGKEGAGAGAEGIAHSGLPEARADGDAKTSGLTCGLVRALRRTQASSASGQELACMEAVGEGAVQMRGLRAALEGAAMAHSLGARQGGRLRVWGQNLVRTADVCLWHRLPAPGLPLRRLCRCGGSAARGWQSHRMWHAEGAGGSVLAWGFHCWLCACSCWEQHAPSLTRPLPCQHYVPYVLSPGPRTQGDPRGSLGFKKGLGC